MKQITAFVQAHVLHRVLKALHECEHYPGVTVSDCEGDGRGRGQSGKYVATTDTLFLKERKRLDLFCADSVCDHLVEVIQRAAHTGKQGDGMIAVSELARVIRIHSGQEQDEAV